MNCHAYYTIAFRVTENVALACELAEDHIGLHRDRRGVQWTTKDKEQEDEHIG